MGGGAVSEDGDGDITVTGTGSLGLNWHAGSQRCFLLTRNLLSVEPFGH